MLSFKEKMSFSLATLYEDAKDDTCMYFIRLNLIFSRISSNLCENFMELPLHLLKKHKAKSRSNHCGSLKLILIIKYPVRYAELNLVLL